MVRLLVEDYKADVEAKDKNDWTVLHAAAQSGNEAVVRMLRGGLQGRRRGEELRWLDSVTRGGGEWERHGGAAASC